MHTYIEAKLNDNHSRLQYRLRAVGALLSESSDPAPFWHNPHRSAKLAAWDQPTAWSRLTGEGLSGFQQTLDHIRSTAETQTGKGRQFERLMRTYFTEDPLYGDRFENVQLWSDWAASEDGFDSQDIGIDLVARERNGGHCAIQCKCYARGTRLARRHVDSFLAASSQSRFTSRILVDTGAEWGPQVAKVIEGADNPTCNVLRYNDLADRPIEWPDLLKEAPEALRVRPGVYSLRKHQQEAFDDVVEGFKEQDRGKLIMACGTGKTFTALRIAEQVAGRGGRVLYLVPSISLLQQTLREWAEQRAFPHRYIGICSDTRAGKTSEDATVQELEIPVTTDRSRISAALAASTPDRMTVVFCTYQSLGLLAHGADMQESSPPPPASSTWFYATRRIEQPA